MLRRISCLLLLFATLGSCSYAYDLLAVVRGGRLAFIVNPTSKDRPSCLRYIEVVAEGSARAASGSGDDKQRVGYGTFWFDSVSYDDACENRFPIFYGVPLSGAHQPGAGIVKGKRLLRNTVYDVSTTTGATGYGSGRFIIRDNGHIENLSLRGSPLDGSTLLENPD